VYEGRIRNKKYGNLQFMMSGNERKKFICRIIEESCFKTLLSLSHYPKCLSLIIETDNVGKTGLVVKRTLI
jgi:hypothetical protein